MHSWKNMENVIFDLDDLAMQPERNCLEDLVLLKHEYPKLKVTLFAIPYYGGVDQSVFFHQIVDNFGDWIELAVHGWDHHSNFECSQWDYKTATDKIREALEMNCFVPGFKAPGWQISRDTYMACKNLGVWVADHKVSAYTESVPNSQRRPSKLKYYEIDHPWMVHGHTWECEGNGLETIMKNVPWNQDTEFHFISDYIKEEYGS